MMAMNVWGRAGAILCLAAALSACSKQNGDPDDSSEESQGGAGNSDEPARTVYVSDNPVSCDADSECDDGNACNGIETCEQGICVYGEAVNCNDGIACTEDKCDAESGECSHTARDEDGDGHGDASCRNEDDIPLGDDCDDSDANRYPGNAEVCTITFRENSATGIGDGRDEDCDPATFGDRDADGDGFIDSNCYNIAENDERNQGRDCNDFIASISPVASEVCDYFDNNCNGEVDEGLTVDRYEDPDGDGYGGTYDPENPGEVTLVERAVCPGEVRVAIDEVDCAPEDRLISPDRDELCDGVDNDCDGEIDEDVVPSTWYRDFDGDGYGNSEGGTRSTCERIDHEGWSLFQGDCDDTNPLVNPSQPEICDGLDNDCNPQTKFLIGPGNTEDDDDDGVADPYCGTARPDCVDTDATVYPGAKELCDGIDNDCNNIVDTRTDEANWYVDADGDGFGTTAGLISSCEPVAGRVNVAGDCNDSDPLVNPGQTDDCNGIHSVDDDCDGETDEGETPVYSYRDIDQDGYGSEEVISFCQPIAGAEYASQGGDCDETAELINPGASELCSPNSTEDRDCDGAMGCSDSQCVDVPECQALYGLQLVDPSGPISAFVSSTFEVTVSLTDADMNPIFPADLSVAGDPGTLTPSGAVPVDASGQATFTIGAGMAEGAYNFTVTSGTTTPLLFTVDAQLPDDGTVWTVLNRSADTSSTVTGSFGPEASLYYPYDIDATSDGHVYVAGQTDVGRLDPVGQFEIIAGNGTGSYSGDGGPALSAGLAYPRFIAVDETQNILYVANSTRVRQVRLDADPPTIYPVAGDGDGPIPGPAELAEIGSVTGLEVLPGGNLLIATSLGVLEYDPSPTSKRVDYYGIYSGGQGNNVGFLNSYGPKLHQQGDKTLFWGPYLVGGDFPSHMPGIAAFESGSAYRMIGNYWGVPNVLMTEGASVHTTHWNGYAPSTAFQDSAGNLVFGPESTFGSSLWKVDSVTQRVHRFVATTTEGIGEEYVPRLDSQFRGVLSLDIGPDGDLWIAEAHAHGRVRRVRSGSSGVRSVLDLELLNDDGATYWPGQTIESVVSQVTDGGGGNASEAVVRQVPDSGWAALYTTDSTDFDGVAFTTGRAEVVLGQQSLQTELWDLDQQLVDAAVLNYEVVSPPSGSVSTWVNANLASGTTPPESQPAVTTRFSTIEGMTVASDGTIYLSTNSHGYAVFKVDSNGITSRVAGGNGAGNSGDFLPALEAKLTTVNDIAVDEANQLLYVLVGSGAGKYIRVIDLSSGIIYPFAGYGSEVGFGGAAMDRETWNIYSIQFHAGNLYLPTAEGVEIIDTTLLSPTIELWLDDVDTTECSTRALTVSYCSTDECQLAFRDDGKAYIAAYMCGTSVTSSNYGVALVDEDGALESLVAGFGSTVSGDEYSALASLNTRAKGLVLDSDGNLYFSEESRHWLRKVTPGGVISTVAGSETGESGQADFVAASDARFYNPTRLNMMPDGSLLILDRSNFAIRRFWP